MAASRAGVRLTLAKVKGTGIATKRPKIKVRIRGACLVIFLVENVSSFERREGDLFGR